MEFLEPARRKSTFQVHSTLAWQLGQATAAVKVFPHTLFSDSATHIYLVQSFPARQVGQCTRTASFPGDVILLEVGFLAALSVLEGIYIIVRSKVAASQHLTLSHAWKFCKYAWFPNMLLTE